MATSIESRPLSRRLSGKHRISETRERIGAQLVIYAVFVVMMAVFAAMAPSFATAGSVSNILRQASAVLIVSVGMTVVIICAEIDLSVGSTASLCGIIGAQLMATGTSWPIAVVASLALGTGIGAINGYLIGYVGVPSFLITLGALEAIGALAQMVTGTLAVAVTSTGFLAVLGYGSLLGIPIEIWWAALVVVTVGYVLHVSVLGRWIYAVGNDRNSARYSGIRPQRIVLLAFVLSGLLASLAGLLLAGQSGAGDPGAGSGMELSAIAAVILGGTDLFGGRGTIVGTVVGAIFIAVLNTGLILLGAGAQLQALTTGIIIIFAVTINRLGQKR